MRRETVYTLIDTVSKIYFNPLPPCGGRLLIIPYFLWVVKFQSTPSVRRETTWVTFKCRRINYFNPLPPCGGRHSVLYHHAHTAEISIHSLRAEGDKLEFRRRMCEEVFQSTPSVRRETITPRKVTSYYLIFQSTPSVRRETFCAIALLDVLLRFQSTPSVRRETPFRNNIRLSLH